MHKQKLMNPNGMVIRVIKKNNKQWVNIEQFVQSIKSSTRSVLCAQESERMGEKLFKIRKFLNFFRVVEFWIHAKKPGIQRTRAVYQASNITFDTRVCVCLWVCSWLMYFGKSSLKFDLP